MKEMESLFTGRSSLLRSGVMQGDGGHEEHRMGSAGAVNGNFVAHHAGNMLGLASHRTQNLW